MRGGPLKPGQGWGPLRARKSRLCRRPINMLRCASAFSLVSDTRLRADGRLGARVTQQLSNFGHDTLAIEQRSEGHLVVDFLLNELALKFIGKHDVAIDVVHGVASLRDFPNYRYLP